MSLDYKVRVTEEQFEVVLTELRARGSHFCAAPWSRKQMEEDYKKSGFTHIDFSTSGLFFEWTDASSPKEVISFEDFMDRLDADISSLRPLRKCHTYSGTFYNAPRQEVVVPSSPVQEQAQAILNARGERNDNTLKNAQEEQEERKYQSLKL